MRPASSMRLFALAIVARFVMFQAEMGHIVAEREQKMVVAVVAHAEQRSGLGDQLVILDLHFRGHLQCGGGVRGDVDFVRRCLARRELNGAEIAPGKHRRVDQCAEWHRRKLDVPAVLLSRR